MKKTHYLLNGKTDNFATELLRRLDCEPRSMDPVYLQGWRDKAESVTKTYIAISEFFTQLRESVVDDHITDDDFEKWVDDVRAEYITLSNVYPEAHEIVEHFCKLGYCEHYIKNYVQDNFRISNDTIDQWISENLPDGEEQRLMNAYDSFFSQYTKEKAGYEGMKSLSDRYGLTFYELRHWISAAEIVSHRLMFEGMSPEDVKQHVTEMIKNGCCHEYICQTASGSGIQEDRIMEWIHERCPAPDPGRTERAKDNFIAEVIDALKNGKKFCAEYYMRKYDVPSELINEWELASLERFIEPSKDSNAPDDSVKLKQKENGYNRTRSRIEIARDMEYDIISMYRILLKDHFKEQDALDLLRRYWW